MYDSQHCNANRSTISLLFPRLSHITSSHHHHRTKTPYPWTNSYIPLQDRRAFKTIAFPLSTSKIQILYSPSSPSQIIP